MCTENVLVSIQTITTSATGIDRTANKKTYLLGASVNKGLTRFVAR